MVEHRLGLLAECFVIAIHAYAVMSNHLHLVVQLAPDVAADWSDAEVAARWVRLFPPRHDSHEAVEAKRQRLLRETERLRVIRSRLSNLSWLMRCLAEPIARQANREDHCKGRFRESRFKAQRLCDERALLAAMAYVALSPARAGVADGLEDSAHTSVATRMAEAGQTREAPGARLGPILGVLRPALAIKRELWVSLFAPPRRAYADSMAAQSAGRVASAGWAAGIGVRSALPSS